MIDDKATYLIQEFIATGQVISVHKLGADASAHDLVQARNYLSWHPNERTVRVLPGTYLTELFKAVHESTEDIRDNAAYKCHQGHGRG